MLNNLTKVSLIVSLLGILVLIILSQQLPIKVYSIDQIDKSLLNKRVAVNASIISVNNYEGFQVILLKDSTGLIKATSFSKKELYKASNNWLVIGKVTEYKDELQIESDKIIKQI